MEHNLIIHSHQSTSRWDRVVSVSIARESKDDAGILWRLIQELFLQSVVHYELLSEAS